MAKVTLFFKAINKDEHLALSFLPRERGYVLTTAKRPVGRPRERKPSAETLPVPNIDCASEIMYLLLRRVLTSNPLGFLTDIVAAAL